MAVQEKPEEVEISEESLFFGPLAGDLFISLAPDGRTARYFYPSAEGQFEEVSAEESARRTREFFGRPVWGDDPQLESEEVVSATSL